MIKINVTMLKNLELDYLMLNKKMIKINITMLKNLELDYLMLNKKNDQN
jgi:ferredoxin-fold anticodon binding domain-containing protein